VNISAPVKPVSAEASVDDLWSQPAAMRLRKPGWRDPRLIIGVILMALGIGIGSIVVSSASNTVSVYVAKGALPAGQALGPEDVLTQQVRIPDHQATYLTPEIATQYWWNEGPRIARSIGPGEVIPLAALTNANIHDLRPVVFTVTTGIDHISVGSVVDLWHVSDVNSEDRPRELAAGLEVSAISDDAGPLSISGAASVTVLVPISQLEEVLNAKSSAGSIELVQHLRGERQ